MADIIGPGSRVCLHYRLSLADGSEVDSSFGGDEPLELIVGDGTLLPRLEALLLGLGAGAHERFLLGPEQAFGERDPGNVHTLERAEFDPAIDLTPGNVVSFATPGGEEIAGTVLEVTGAHVSVDFNHPLAGRDIVFEVQVLGVQ